MKYDFDKIIDRRNTYSVKYDFIAENGKREDIIPMWIADMDLGTCPNIVSALKERAGHGIFGYTMPKRRYFEAVSGWFSRRSGWQPDPDDFICTPGVVFALNTFIKSLTSEGDAVLVCQPVYYPFASSVKYNKRKLVVSGLIKEGCEYRVDYEDFERKIVENGVKLFILCSPHNPVGRVWRREELIKMGEICLRHNVFVISDEIHSDFVYGENRHIPFPMADGRFKEISAVCTSPSKSFNLAGMQISNIYIPRKDVRKKFEDELDSIGYWEPNVMGVTACYAAYTEGDEWFSDLKEYIYSNLVFAAEYIRKNIPGVTAYVPEGTYLLWLDFSELRLSDGDLTKLTETKAGLWLDDGYIFGEGGSGFERVNAACPRSVLLKALERLERAVKALS